jgi:5S rRNA maturation endonuclease (ribonuclease M5)
MDYVGTANRRQHVEDQLAQYSGAKKPGNGSTFVICPYHSEKTPSGRVFHAASTTAPGSFKCYGCGMKASWNEIAPKLGLMPFGPQKPDEEYANSGLLMDQELVEDTGFVKERMRFRDLPEDRTWRNIPTSLLISIGAKLCQVKHEEHGWLKPKVYLPVLINKKLRGYIKARMKKHDDFPSYINAKGQWSKTHGLFPYDMAIKLSRRLGTHTIVLVEGPRDALRLLMLGVPAMCILGTQSWTDTKTKILELSGVQRVILLMDGDDAGKEATAMLETRLESMFEVVTLKLWALRGSPYIQFKNKREPSKAAKKAGVALWDPCSAPERIIQKIKKLYF